MAEQDPQNAPVVDGPEFTRDDLAEELIAIRKANKSEKREKLTDEELGVLISATGNHEAKAIVLAILATAGEGRSFGLSELNKELASKQGDVPVWEPNTFDYCEASFEKIGLVAKHVIIGEGVHYTITEDGEELGLPLVGHLLHFSLHHDLSLRQVFGLTHSTNTELRSPMQRLAILKELVTAKLPINLKTLFSELGISLSNTNTTKNQLSNLKKDGVINIETKSGVGLVWEYETADTINEYEAMPGSGSFTRDVVVAINELYGVNTEGPILKFGINDIIGKLIANDKKYLDQTSVRGRVGKVLADLDQQGKIKSLQDLDSLTAISIDSETQQTLEELLNLLDKFAGLKTEFLLQGKQYALGILASPESVKSLVAKARANSPEANRFSREAQNNLILKAVESLDGPVDYTEIAAAIEIPAGVRLTSRMIKETLGRLYKADKIDSKLAGRERMYERKYQRATVEEPNSQTS